MPYPPPCQPGDRQLGGFCYPAFRNFNVAPGVNALTLTLGGLPKELMPIVADTLEDGSHMIVQKSGDKVDLTLTGLQQEHVSRLIELLG